MRTFVQIGTNRGNDAFCKLVKYSNADLTILVEPNASLITSIQKSYEGVANVFIENVAITKSEQGKVVLSRPNIPPRRGFSDAHYTLVPMDTWGNDLLRIEADSMTFMQLCEKHDLKHIFYLGIDTEGYDSEIINSIDFKSVSIDIIKYEIWPFDSSYFLKYGEDAKFYGLEAMENTEKLLIMEGYSCMSDGIDITAIRLK